MTAPRQISTSLRLQQQSSQPQSNRVSRAPKLRDSFAYQTSTVAAVDTHPLQEKTQTVKHRGLKASPLPPPLDEVPVLQHTSQSMSPQVKTAQSKELPHTCAQKVDGEMPLLQRTPMVSPTNILKMQTVM